MSENLGKMTPFMKLFWEQQNQFTKNKSATSNRYHPIIIRFCLPLASKSASAYDELRSSNVLALPSRRTLRDYKNFSRFPRILCMHLFYFDISLNITSPLADVNIIDEIPTKFSNLS